jgi:ThiF family
MRTWPDQFPGRLEHELEEFAERGLAFSLDDDLLAEQGKVVLRGTIEDQGEDVDLEVHYPDLYPFIRPEIVAPDRELPRHQNPYEGNLCLLDRSSRAWKPSYTAAWLVAEKVPYLLALLRADENEMREVETPQGEPLSSYFPGVPGTVLFVPDAMLSLPEDASAGSGRIGFAQYEGPQLWVRGAVVELVEKVRSRKTRTLARADEPVKRRFSGAEIPFRWVRLDELPKENTPIALLNAIESAKPGFGSPPWEGVAGGSIAISGAVFREEVGQGEYQDGWLFVVQQRVDQGESRRYLIRGERLSRKDLEVRLPGHLRLEDRCVSLAGLGALGGDIAIELAKSGLGKLRGLDFDQVEAGTIVRWTAGLTAVGRLKTGYMSQRIAVDYPYTTFEAYPLLIGGSTYGQEPRGVSELDAIDRFLDGSDLLVDATAEIGVQQALAFQANARHLHQIFVSATEGARGGLVAKIDPAAGGCWLCLQLQIEDGSIPIPAHAEPLTLQPRGCTSLTYTGAGFDLLPIIAQAVRVAAATLSEVTEPGSFAYVCSLSDDNVEPPHWSTHIIDRLPECPVCGQVQEQ